MKYVFVVASALWLSGCNIIPDALDLDTEVAGNYQALADCVYVDLTAGIVATAATKVELPSQSRSRLRIGVPPAIIGDLDFINLGDVRTRVTLRHQRGIYGKDFYANRYMQTVNRCSAQLAAI